MRLLEVLTVVRSDMRYLTFAKYRIIILMVYFNLPPNSSIFAFQIAGP